MKKAFFICFEMSVITQSLSAKQMEIKYRIARQAACLFFHKIREATKSSEKHLITEEIPVDELTLGGKENDNVGPHQFILSFFDV